MTSTQPRQTISVFFPAFNDAGSITRLVTDALAVLSVLSDDYEVVVINDGSTDSTALELAKLIAKEPHLRVIHHERNMGYGAALRSGFSNSQKDLIFYTDGDGQYDVNQLRDLHNLLTEGVDVVNGFKQNRADSSGRKVVGAIYNQLAHLFFGLPIRDVDCDFRLIRKSIMKNVQLTSSNGSICIELIYKLRLAGAVFAETPVNHFPRRYGQSQFFTFSRVSRTIRDFFLLWWRLVASPHLVRIRRELRKLNASNEVAR